MEFIGDKEDYSMNKVFNLCNKKYNLKYEKNPIYQTLYKNLTSLNEKYHLDLYNHNEFDCFRNEILYYSLLNKIAFEDCFLKTYVNMYDYWYDLLYQERKHQMNVDIDLMRTSLPCFQYQEQLIYLPFFDELMNQMYLEEMVLFDLKQYGKFRNEFKELIQIPRYGSALYDSDFTSLELIREKDSQIIVYSRAMNRLYFLENDQFVESISMISEKSDATKEQLLKIIELYEEDNEIELINQLIDEGFVDEKLSKKLKKIQNKCIKKAS